MRKFSLALLLCLLMVPAVGRTATVVIEEYFDPSTRTGSFGIKNLGSDALVAFAVANDTLISVDGTHEFYRKWAAGIITESNWNADKAVFEQAISQVVPNFSIPSFGTLFPGYTKAAIYWAHDILGPTEQALVAGIGWEPGTLNLRNPTSESCLCYYSQPIPGGDDSTYSSWGQLGFWFNATSHSSPFVALTQKFQLVQGEAVLTAVPEPTAAVLMSIALGLLGVRIKRRQCRRPSPHPSR